MPDTRNTKDVETLLGDPRRAVISMAVPLAIGMIAQSANNIIDAAWVSGLGADALAATGVVFPVFFILIAIGNGIGVGASAIISRLIGSNNREEADRTASQAILLSILVSAIVTVAVLLLLKPMLMAMGAEGTVMEEGIAYGLPLLLGSAIVVNICVMSALLRSEGAAKRSMNIQFVAAGVNIILDPLFIYILDMGMFGAGLATVVSIAAGTAASYWWYFVKKDTYLRIVLRGVRPDWGIVRSILSIGVPASLGMIVISISMVLMNRIVFEAGGSDGIAIFTTTWRVINFLQIPMMGIGSALVSVSAAAYGARRGDKIKETFYFGVKSAAAITLALAFVVALFGDYATLPFTSAGDTQRLRPEMVYFLWVSVLFLPFSALGFTSSSMFQSFGMGGKSLIMILLINITQIPLCAAWVILFNGDMHSIYYGVAITESAGSLVALIWARAIMLEKVRMLSNKSESRRDKALADGNEMESGAEDVI